jgi:thiol-disulfide isomerase/thioredoxin
MIKSRFVAWVFYAFLAVLAAQASFLLWRDQNFGTLYAQVPPTDQLEGRVEVPEFPDSVEWLNTGGESLQFADELRGKIVLLDFWTYGCINCIHVIPVLKQLEERYPNEIVVIGVHTAKFANEGETDNIRRFIQRHELAHPVINDRDYEIWRSYRVNAWPTLVLINPLGRAVGYIQGESDFETLDNYVSAMVDLFDARGELDRIPLDLELEFADLDTGDLRFPAKVLVDDDGERIFIADTGNHRVIQTDLDGRVQRVYGTGEIGLVDGAAADAQFHQPRGLALWDADTLFVTDTNNHAIRRIDLRSGEVATVAGNGTQQFLFQDEADPINDGMRSPWDVLRVGEWLYVAMAGQHQIWRYRPSDQRFEAYAGSRREELRDGPRLSAGLNQPSGMASDGEYLYIADSEASAIRRIQITGDERLETLIGTGLFDFGDVDGVGTGVLLQHPLAVGLYRGDVIIADTYNSKLKILDVETLEVSTLVANDLMEPGGLSVADGSVFIADTNNHAIRVYEVESDTLLTLNISDPDELL